MSSYIIKNFFEKINDNLDRLEREINRISNLSVGKREEIKKLYVTIYEEEKSVIELFNNDLRFIKDECERKTNNTQKCEDIRLRFLSLIKRVKDMYTYLYKDVGKNILSFIGDTDEDVNIDKIGRFLEEAMDPLDKGGKEVLTKEFLCKVPKYLDGDTFLNNYNENIKYDGINIDETFKSFFSDPEIECINNLFYFVGNSKKLFIRAILEDRDENEFKSYLIDNWEIFNNRHAGQEFVEAMKRLVEIIYNKGDISFLKTLPLKIKSLNRYEIRNNILNIGEYYGGEYISPNDDFEVELVRLPPKAQLHIQYAIGAYQFIRYNKKLIQFIKLINNITYVRIETNCNLKTIKYKINPIKVLIIDIEGSPDIKKEKEIMLRGLKSIAGRNYIKYDDNISITELFKKVYDEVVNPRTSDYNYFVDIDDRHFLDATFLMFPRDLYLPNEIDYLIIKDTTSKFLYIKDQNINIKKGIFSLNSKDFHVKNNNLNYFSFTFEDTERINYRQLEYCNENQDVGDIKKMLEKKCGLKIYTHEEISR